MRTAKNYYLDLKLYNLIGWMVPACIVCITAIWRYTDYRDPILWVSVNFWTIFFFLGSQKSYFKLLVTSELWSKVRVSPMFQFLIARFYGFHRFTPPDILINLRWCTWTWIKNDIKHVQGPNALWILPDRSFLVVFQVLGELRWAGLSFLRHSCCDHYLCKYTHKIRNICIISNVKHNSTKGSYCVKYQRLVKE